MENTLEIKDFDNIMDAATADIEDTTKTKLAELAAHRDVAAPELRFAMPRTKVREYKKVGRNDPCPCGSGDKYKNCCMDSGKYEQLIDA